MFKVLISVWLGYILIHGWIPYELIEIIRLGRIEVLPVCTEKLHDRQIELFHAHHHHLSHLVGTVWIEVGVILQSLSLVGISICRIVNQRLLTVLIPQGLEESAGHIVKFYHRHALSLRHSSHGIRIIAMSFLNLAMGSIVKTAALGRSYEDDVATLLAYLVDDFDFYPLFVFYNTFSLSFCFAV